jgi:uncharacterized glyoxalase superfamily protein PhnB
MTATSTATRVGIQIKAAVPTFLVPAVADTARWYSEHLAFRTAGTFPKQEPYAYANLQRDGAEIMLLSLAGYEKPNLSARRPQGLWDAYVRMREVHALYDALRDRTFVQMPLKQQPYGGWSSKCAIRMATFSCSAGSHRPPQKARAELKLAGRPCGTTCEYWRPGRGAPSRISKQQQ